MEDFEPPVLSRLPLSLQSFEDLRKRNYIYVDKTQYVYMLVNQGKSYFLARPRRFGKSLLCNTLRAYFEGKKELFEGLKIYHWEKNWTKYPILYLDFADGDYSIGSLTLVNKMRTALIDFEASNDISFDDNSIIIDKESDPLKNEAMKLSFRLESDLKAVYEKTGLGTVFIADEYDNPLIKSANLDTDKGIYRGFFSVLKSADKYIRFALW